MTSDRATKAQPSNPAIAIPPGTMIHALAYHGVTI